jgi:hypothetical protein
MLVAAVRCCRSLQLFHCADDMPLCSLPVAPVVLQGCSAVMLLCVVVPLCWLIYRRN